VQTKMPRLTTPLNLYSTAAKSPRRKLDSEPASLNSQRPGTCLHKSSIRMQLDPLRGWQMWRVRR
jgi:hypothetical protein